MIRSVAVTMACALAVCATPSWSKDATTPAVRAQPLVPPIEWIDSFDYPSVAIADRIEGKTSVSLDIGPDGKIIRCNVTESSGAAVLDEATCAAITSRAKFAPARDAKGRPVADRFIRHVNWKLPDSGLMRVSEYPERHITILDVNEAGVVESCQVTGSSAGRDDIRYSQEPCKQDEYKQRGPVIGADGKPIRARITEIWETQVTPR